jgi:hypothetical protein
MSLVVHRNGFGSQEKGWRKVMDCSLNLGYFFMKANLYVMILGSYDIIINMDWLESHEAILNCKKTIEFDR